MSIGFETIALWRVERWKNCRDRPSDVLSCAEVSTDEKWGIAGSKEALLLVGYRRILKSERQTGVMTRFAKKNSHRKTVGQPGKARRRKNCLLAGSRYHVEIQETKRHLNKPCVLKSTTETLLYIERL